MLERKEFIQKTEEYIFRIAKKCIGIAAVIGSPTINESERGKKLFNSALFIENGKVSSLHHKSLLPTYDIFDEYRHFEPNSKLDMPVRP